MVRSCSSNLNLDEITKLGLNSLLEPLPATYKETDFQLALSQLKVSIILRLIQNGYNVFYMDPASVVLKDFFKNILQYVQNPYNADIMLTAHGETLINIDFQTLSFRSDVLYVRQTSGAISLLGKIKAFMGDRPNTDLEDSLNSIIHQGNKVQVTGVGKTPQDALYPSGTQQISSKDYGSFSDLTHFFSAENPAETQNEISRIHVLDPLKFSTSKVFLKEKNKIGSREQSAVLVLASNQPDAENLFKSEKLWYLDLNYMCIPN
jgi:hypothetical protein